jgi:hypothetical protein
MLNQSTLDKLARLCLTPQQTPGTTMNVRRTRSHRPIWRSYATT